VDDYVTVPDSSVWAFGTNDFSIELWTKFNSVRSDSSYGQPANVFVGQDEAGGSHNKWVFYLNNGLYFHINGSVSVYIGPIPFSPIVGQWYHLSLTRSGSTYSFYVDGTLLGTESNANSSPDVNAPLTLGQVEGLGYFDGLIDEVEIFNRALSASEIAAVSNAGSAGICKIDTIPPTVTMSSAASDPTDASPIAVTVQFSETVTGFMSDDIVTSNGTVSNFVVVDGDTYNFNLTPSGQGLVTADVAAGVASDLADNGNTAATQFSRTYAPIYNLFLPLIKR
jgi:hypothetical protein